MLRRIIREALLKRLEVLPNLFVLRSQPYCFFEVRANLRCWKSSFRTGNRQPLMERRLDDIGGGKFQGAFAHSPTVIEAACGEKMMREKEGRPNDWGSV